MRLEVKRVGPEHRAAVERLVQLYQYDFSEFDGADVGADGCFRGIDVAPYLASEHSAAYVALVDGRLAGLALVSLGPSRLVASGEVWRMSEFFVLKKYRRRGVGERFAVELFDRHPGRWEVAEISENRPAQAFWRRVIARYAGGEAIECRLRDEDWDGPVQLFSSQSPLEGGEA